MRIEVAVPSDATTKDRGDLLEALAAELLKAQSYEITQQVRMTGVELDLLCRHKVSGKQIYVECKAHRSNLDANVLKTMAGTQALHDYDEAWLISTSDLGKEAKGFVVEWKKKPSADASKMSFYTPDKVIQALSDSKTVANPPVHDAQMISDLEHPLGEWTLCLTPYGRFWLTSTLAGGIPSGVLAFFAENNKQVTDEELLRRLSETDTSLSGLDFLEGAANLPSPSETSPQEESASVVEVQHGESWADYRPARPKDFVGRTKDVGFLFDFFKSIEEQGTGTRIFAITGDSGMGKSSLITKIVHAARGRRMRKRYFVYAVDVRAATSPAYIYAALLKCLQEAQRSGFGDSHLRLSVTDPANPLNSSMIKQFLASVSDKKQLVVLIFDQFEELFSKPELYEVFAQARKLFLATASFKGSLSLGFAWKSDSTTPSDHPAYYFWHQLSDYRVSRKLLPFTDGESKSAIGLFEKELDKKLHNDLKHNLLVSSQGYPWLLKKLCIHLYERIREGAEQTDLIENTLDVASLFDSDLEQLSQAERACLEFVALRAPVDWFEVLEISGHTTLNSLIDRRLVVRSGDRLNIYWDIFREYLLTKRVPIIPLRYLPSTDFSSVYKVAEHLSNSETVSVQELVTRSGLSEGTVMNIGTDLYTFGIASREDGGYQLQPGIKEKDSESLLLHVREKLKRHAFTRALQSRPSNAVLSTDEAIRILKEALPNVTYADKTWRTYTVRLCRWLNLCGLVVGEVNGWIYRDKGGVNKPQTVSTRLKGLFTAPTSPAIASEVLEWLCSVREVARGELPKGYRNGLLLLKRFGLARVEGGLIQLSASKMSDYSSSIEAIWTAALAETTLQEAVELLEHDPFISGRSVGEYFNAKYGMGWTKASEVRNGSAIRKWAAWVLQSKSSSGIPPLPGRVKDKSSELLFQ